MNCQQFDKIVMDLAHSQSRALLMDAQVKTEGLAHADECVHCAARLDDEKALNVGLSVLSATDAKLEAPAHVESALMAAFRKQAAATPVIQPAATTINHQRVYWLRWAVAAAAIITLAMLGWSQLPAKQDQMIVREETVKQPTNPPKSDDQVSVNPAAVSTQIPEQIERASYEPSSRTNKGARRTRTEHDESRVVDFGAMQVVSQPEAVATDFIPINYAGSQTPLDSGQIIRVKMPRAALASFGLPVNAERSHEPIKADVLYGADGMARAVRFIQE
ncbi:MAG TPA: hypothetical protein VEF04_22685 [Blastocatellia bacterium]|nr:hypothetical protein [Blastocatellia bacterium]